MGIRNVEINDYIQQFDNGKLERFECIRNLVHNTIPEVEEKLWTKVPCFYVGKKTVVIRVFKDHMNLFAQDATRYQENLKDYVITPKGALQIFDHQELPCQVLKQIIKDTLS